MWSLVSQLPPDSAYGRATAGDEGVWSQESHLLAATVDALWLAIWQRGGNPNATKPKPIPRPGLTVVEETPARKYTKAELDAIFTDRRARARARNKKKR